MPWNEYGDVDGLNAPPRRIVAPAALTARAVVISCSSDSTVQGPAIMTNSSPPITTPSTVTVLFSGRYSREAKR